ncbi:Nn.00g084950.m01.CDS01 [Neocucurbitaria sp. VM-36]
MTSEHKQVDYIRKVALIGGTGQLGSHFLKHLLANGKHTVTVLTRPESTATFPTDPNLKITKVDYSSEDSLVKALRGNDFLIITLSVRAPPTQHGEIVTAAAKAGVHCIMPNYYSFGLGSRGGALSTDPLLGSFERFINDVKKHEELHYVALCCGFWYEFSLGMGEPWYGFDIKKRSVTFYDEGTRKINTSTWEQCGRAVAALLALPVPKQDDGKLAVQDWKDQGLYVSSFLVSQRDMLDSLNRVLGTTDEDWSIMSEKTGERYKKGVEEFQSGNMLGFAKAMYARLFFESGEGDYETGYELDNAKLGLPKEDFDEATKRAVEMVEGGFGIHG